MKSTPGTLSWWQILLFPNIKCFKLCEIFSQQEKYFPGCCWNIFHSLIIFNTNWQAGWDVFVEDLSLYFCEHFVFISLTFLRPVEHFNCEIFGQNIHTNNKYTCPRYLQALYFFFIMDQKLRLLFSLNLIVKHLSPVLSSRLEIVYFKPHYASKLVF